jgi:radical SAM protein with 4Fe4S-binding SPASM domain
MKMIDHNQTVSLPSEMYAHLRDDVLLKISPSYGIIQRNDGSERRTISRQTAEALTLLDGRQKISKIINQYIHNSNCSDLEICKIMIQVAEFIMDGFIVLDNREIISKSRIEGDFTAFYPSSMHVELTKACNLNCYYCYRDAKADQTKDRLETDKLLEILLFLSKKGLHAVELTGGEPLMHPDFSRIMKFVGEHFSLIGLLTNGTLITESILNDMIPFRDKIAVSISLDSHIPSVHDERRGFDGAFDKTTKAIQLFARNGFITRVTMALDEYNWRHIEPTMQLSRRLGATMFSYAPILPFGRAKNHLNFDFWANNTDEIIETEKRLFREYKGFLRLLPEDVLKPNDLGGCGAGHKSYTMDPRGWIRPCPTFEETQAIFGCFEHQDSSGIFGGELSMSFANIQPPNPDICQTCEFTYFCMNCSLRGLLGMKWVGEKNCSWMNQPRIQKWKDLVQSHEYKGRQQSV